MDKAKENLGNVIRHARENAGLTQTKLSEALDLGDKTILNIENYRGNPKFDNLYRLVNYLKIPGNALFYPETSGDSSSKELLLLEIHSCSEQEATELLRVVRYMLELLRRQDEPS